MKLDKLKQYVSLRSGLVAEKAELEARLAEINKALGETSPVVAKAAAAAPAAGKRRPGRPPGRSAAASSGAAPAGASAPRTRRPRNGGSLRDVVVNVLKTNKSLTRQELLKAVVAAGYKFSAKDPLNSLSTLVYTAKKLFKATDGKISLV